MKTSNVLMLLRKDLRLGPRSPLLLYALVLPVLLTLLVRGVFGSLFDPQPRLGIVDLGGSELTVQAEALDGFDVVVLTDADALRRQVEDNDLDGGLVIPPGFDDAVRAGERPGLEFVVGGESLASNRILIAVTTLDLIRRVAGEEPPAEVRIVTIGDEGLAIETRLVPALVMLAVAIAGVMVSAASLIQEKEKRTLDALLVTPVSIFDVLAAKGAMGALLAVLTGVATLVLNGAMGPAPIALTFAVLIGAVMMAEIGLLLGIWSKDQNTMFTAWKSGGILILFPAIFYVWPGLPAWIAKLGPTYYFLQPMFALSIEGASFGDVAPQLAVGLLICAALVPAVIAAGRWLEGARGSGAAAAPAVEVEAEELAEV